MVAKKTQENGVLLLISCTRRLKTAHKIFLPNYYITVHCHLFTMHI